MLQLQSKVYNIGSDTFGNPIFFFQALSPISWLAFVPSRDHGLAHDVNGELNDEALEQVDDLCWEQKPAVRWAIKPEKRKNGYLLACFSV